MIPAAGQVPPQDIAAEESVLGALMVTDSAWFAVQAHGLRTEDFYKDRHRVLFATISELAGSAKPCDEIMVASTLERSGRMKEAGGRHYLSDLAAKVPAAGNAGHHAAIIVSHAVRREMQDIGRELATDLEPAEAIERLRVVDRRSANVSPVRRADICRVKPTSWLWKLRLPVGYLSLLLGAEGIGKGTLSAWIAARVTRGELDGYLNGRPSRVLFVADEDGFDSVWVPRLYAAGADLDLIDTLGEETELEIPRDAELLRSWIEEHDYCLVFLDALLDALGAEVDDWRSKSVRDAIRPLRRIARETQTTFLGSLHPNKGSRSSFRDLISGSHAFNAVSRSSLLLTTLHPRNGSSALPSASFVSSDIVPSSTERDAACKNSL